MPIAHAQIPMGPESEGTVLELLQRTLDPSAPDFPHRLQELACRVDQDLGRLPWAEGFLAWLMTQPEAAHRESVQCLWNIAATDPSPGTARGAALVLLTLAENTPEFEEQLLFDLACQTASTEVARMVGAYLLATARTRPKALAELVKVPVLTGLVREQMDGEQLLGLWCTWLIEAARGADGAHGEIVFSLIQERPELHFVLRNSLLDVFDRLTGDEQQSLVRFLLSGVEAKPQQVKRFVSDLLQYSPFHQIAQQIFGPELERQIGEDAAIS